MDYWGLNCLWDVCLSLFGLYTKILHAGQLINNRYLSLCDRGTSMVGVRALCCVTDLRASSHSERDKEALWALFKNKGTNAINEAHSHDLITS